MSCRKTLRIALCVDVLFGFESPDLSLDEVLCPVGGCAGLRELCLFQCVVVVALSAIDSRHSEMADPVIRKLLLIGTVCGPGFVKFLRALELAGVRVRLSCIGPG